uniref:Uncharacterized protein n=1 Tax=Romanomermis culicivorax TaxID=13658 RepID=A0A915L8E4_ROMCU
MTRETGNFSPNLQPFDLINYCKRNRQQTDGIEWGNKKYNAVLFGLPDSKDNLTEIRKLVSTYNDELDNNMDDSDIVEVS